mmetsp:Transcript_57557/g.167144  ORF Transcript_57557/g.167144 Transcript_57557/m.167144 type:complete len:283 (-) Transcript_57557:155-1003(-)
MAQILEAASQHDLKLHQDRHHDPLWVYGEHPLTVQERQDASVHVDMPRHLLDQQAGHLLNLGPRGTPPRQLRRLLPLSAALRNRRPLRTTEAGALGNASSCCGRSRRRWGHDAYHLAPTAVSLHRLGSDAAVVAVLLRVGEARRAADGGALEEAGNEVGHLLPMLLEPLVLSEGAGPPVHHEADAGRRLLGERAPQEGGGGAHNVQEQQDLERPIHGVNPMRGNGLPIRGSGAHPPNPEALAQALIDTLVRALLVQDAVHPLREEVGRLVAECCKGKQDQHR